MNVIRQLWSQLATWQKGATAGALAFLAFGLGALVLCLLEHLGMIEEGYVSAGWILLFFGLPSTLIEALLESADPTFSQQLVNLFLLAFLNSVLAGSLVGLLIGRRRHSRGISQ